MGEKEQRALMHQVADAWLDLSSALLLGANAAGATQREEILAWMRDGLMQFPVPEARPRVLVKLSAERLLSAYETLKAAIEKGAGL